jgi:hypothetical protein
MDDLKQIINTFSTDEQKEFASFIQRQKKLKNRKDLELFKLLSHKQTYKSAQILAKLYPNDTNQVAYHAVRKRLMKHLIDFILLKSDGKQQATVLGLISFALFDRKLEKLAWELLKKAEKVALAYEQHDLLNAIYNLQINQADSEFADDLTVIIEKYHKNKIYAEEDEKANIANKLIQQKLKEVRLQGNELNFKEIVKSVLQAYNLSEVIAKRPSLLYKLMTITRSAVLVSKDFFHFEPYITEQYQFVTEKYGFQAQHAHYELNILYMIAHVLYRNKKFSQSIGYLEKMKNIMSGKKNLENDFYAKYTLLLAANYALCKQTHLSIQLVEEALKDKKNYLSQEDSLNAYLNLSIYYFQEENYKKANQCFIAVQSSETWLVKKMGREWVLKKNLIELIAQYELKNYDLSRTKIKNIEKNFADMIAQPLYQNVKAYLYFIKQLLDNPTIKPEQLFAQTNTLFSFDPIAEEDLQEIRFYAWLKAKLLKKKYQEVLTELTNRVTNF